MILAAMAAPAAAAEPTLQWTGPVTINGSDVIADIDCPTSSLCVAVDQSGKAITTTNPTGAAGDWHSAQIFDFSLSGVSCSSSNLCVAVSNNECPPGQPCPAVEEPGSVVTTSNPTGGAAAWTEAVIPGTGDLYSIDCTTGLCAALDINSQIVTSTNPAGGAGAWDVADVAGTSTLALRGISCPSASLCVAVGREMHDLGGGFKVLENVILTSTNPTGGAGAWMKTYLGFNSYLSAIDCPTTSFCLAVDEWGQAWSSTNPTGGEGAWSEQVIAGNEFLVDVSCPSATFCAVVDEGGRALTSVNPTGGSEVWATSAIPTVFNVSCPSSDLCVAAGAGYVVVGKPPVAEPPAPQPTPTPILPIQPSLTLASLSKLSVTKGWVKLPQLSCTGYTACSGGIQISVASSLIPNQAGRAPRPGQTTIASRAFSISPGMTMQLLVRLSKKGKRLLARKKKVGAKLQIDGRATDQVFRVNKPVTLRLKR
jgi:hypothetical protein